MRTMIAATGLALVLAACSSAPLETRPPPPRAVPPAPRSPPPAAARDQCGAYALQHLVGRPRTEIPVPVEPSRQRVACTTCPVTQDYSPGRLNFFFDADTGIIKQIRCG